MRWTVYVTSIRFLLNNRPIRCGFFFSAFALILSYRAFFECFISRHDIHVGPAIPTSAYLRAATLGTNWVHWPSGSDFGQAQRSITSYSCFSLGLGRINTRYTKEPRFTIPFDGRNEPRMISPMWPRDLSLIWRTRLTIRPSGLLRCGLI
jgi:hypothetical protein